MCVIAGKVVIDQFTLKLPQAVYLLSHWHSDHYQGITHSWKQPIFTSPITKQLLLTKYPSLESQVTPLPLGQWTQLTPSVSVLPFDANHMAGSVMFLLKIGQNPNFEYYLHTGDTRCSPKIAQNTPQVFQTDSENEFKCKFKIEELHLDNTFCDPVFQFPPKSKAIRMLADLVEQLQPTRLFLSTDSAGKEEAFLALSKHYKVRIAVSHSRLTYIKAMNLPMQYFTLDASKTWIQVIPKGEQDQRVKETKGAVAMTLTGWTNLSHPYPSGTNSYLIPYSLHSNFEEMEQLVRWVRPLRLVPVVKEGGKRWEKFGKSDSNFKGYMFSLYGLKQRGLDYLRKQYCGLQTQSQIQQN